MKTQNYANHARFVPLYHFFTVIGTLVLLIGSVVNLYKSSGDNIYNASLIVFGSLLLLLTAFYARVFALKAQDRAIKAEENFRHYILTGKAMDSQLTMSQIVALRFSSDEEFPELAQKALNEKLSANAIKKTIGTWKPDFYRV